jgi:hypothetical protein
MVSKCNEVFLDNQPSQNGMDMHFSNTAFSIILG